MDVNDVAGGTAPLITAVIPTFQRPRLLQRAVTSVLEQQGAPLKVCVYDNASGDETAAAVESIAVKDSRLRYHCHATNIGGAANFEFGLRHVETPFFSILSDDDYLLPDFYQRALAGLAAHPGAMFWAGVVLNVDMDGVIWDARMTRWQREGLFVPPEGFISMTGGMAPTWTGIVFRREVLDREGFPDPETRGPADLEYCLRLAARFSYVVEKHPSARRSRCLRSGLAGSGCCGNSRQTGDWMTPVGRRHLLPCAVTRHACCSGVPPTGSPQAVSGLQEMRPMLWKLIADWPTEPVFCVPWLRRADIARLLSVPIHGLTVWPSGASSAREANCRRDTGIC